MKIMTKNDNAENKDLKYVKVRDLEFGKSAELMLENVCYMGKPFTGTAKEKNKEGFSAEYHFVDGRCHGRYTCNYPSGRLMQESFFENGKLLNEKTWTEDGLLISYHVFEPDSLQYFYPNGKIAKEETEDHCCEWFEDGSIRFRYDISDSYGMLYAKDGTWVAKITVENNHVEYRRGKIEFNEEFVSKNYIKIMEDDVFSNDYISLWLPEPPKTADYVPPFWVSEAICKMIQSDNLYVKDSGIILSVNYIVLNAIPLLEKELRNKKKPDDIIDCDRVLEYTRTIGKQASFSLNILKKVKQERARIILSERKK